MSERVSHFQNHVVSQVISVNTGNVVMTGLHMKQYRPLTTCLGSERTVNFGSDSWTLILPHGRWRSRDPGFPHFAADVAEVLQVVKYNLACAACERRKVRTKGCAAIVREVRLGSGKPGIELQSLCTPCAYGLLRPSSRPSRTFNELASRGWFMMPEGDDLERYDEETWRNVDAFLADEGPQMYCALCHEVPVDVDNTSSVVVEASGDKFTAAVICRVCRGKHHENELLNLAKAGKISNSILVRN